MRASSAPGGTSRRGGADPLEGGCGRAVGDLAVVAETVAQRFEDDALDADCHGLFGR